MATRSPFQPIRCLRFESGLQSQFYDLGSTSISKKRRQSCRAKNLVERHIYAYIAWVNCVDPDQPAHPCHLIRTYTVRCLWYHYISRWFNFRVFCARQSVRNSTPSKLNNLKVFLYRNIELREFMPPRICYLRDLRENSSPRN